MTKLIIKPKRHECSINGCRNKNCYLLTKSREHINPFWMCEDDIVEAYRLLIAIKPELAIVPTELFVPHDSFGKIQANGPSCSPPEPPIDAVPVALNDNQNGHITTGTIKAVGCSDEQDKTLESDFECESSCIEDDPALTIAMFEDATNGKSAHETRSEQMKRQVAERLATVQSADDIPKVQDVYNANVHDTTEMIPRARYKKPTPKQAQAKGKGK